MYPVFYFFIKGFHLLLPRHCGARLRVIGERFSLSDAAVTLASRRMRVASENDEKMRKRLDEMKFKLKLSVVETWPFKVL
jgi:hypothetical protein